MRADWCAAHFSGGECRKAATVVSPSCGEQRELCGNVTRTAPHGSRISILSIRQHWSIENQLHWVLDIIFTEDASRIRKQDAPQTSAMLRRLAVSILSRDTSLKDSLRGKRYSVGLSTDILERILLSFVEK